MGDMLYPWRYYPIPVEDVYGLGVAGFSIEQFEETPVEKAERKAVQKEDAEYSDESVGKNIDTQA